MASRAAALQGIFWCSRSMWNDISPSGNWPSGLPSSRIFEITMMSSRPDSGETRRDFSIRPENLAEFDEVGFGDLLVVQDEQMMFQERLAEHLGFVRPDMAEIEAGDFSAEGGVERRDLEHWISLTYVVAERASSRNVLIAGRGDKT